MRPFLKPLVLVLALSGVAGCATLAEWYARATSVRPDTGAIPAVEIGKNVPTLVGNPGNVDAWLDIADALLYIIVGGGAAGVGAITVRRKLLARRKNASGS